MLLKTRFEIAEITRFEIAEITRFLIFLAAIHLLFKIVINFKVLEISQDYIYSEDICL